MTSALHALQLVTRLKTVGVRVASYELFKTIVASDDLTDQHWEAARLAARRAVRMGSKITSSSPGEGECKVILKLLDYHLGLRGSGKDHVPSIAFALETIIRQRDGWVDPLTAECIRGFNCASPSFVRGMHLIMRPDNPLELWRSATRLISLASDQWFNSPTPVMEPEEMVEFCEHLAVFMIDGHTPRLVTWRSSATILFGMLRSQEWRKHIVTRLWGVFAFCGLVGKEQESFRWCLRNAIELLEFTRGLSDGEGLKWWYATLWFHYDKLDSTVRDEVERIARDMLLNDRLSDLNSCLDLIENEVAWIRKRPEEPYWFTMELGDRLIVLEGNYNRLAQITRGG